MSISQISRSQGSSRIRTQDLKKIRADLKKTSPNLSGDPRREIFSQSNNIHINLQENKHDQLPPEWVDTYEKIQEDLLKLEQKSIS